jgi:hypothetical protein
MSKATTVDWLFAAWNCPVFLYSAHELIVKFLMTTATGLVMSDLAISMAS